MSIINNYRAALLIAAAALAPAALTAAEPLPAPTGLTIEETADGFRLSWLAVEGATDYTVNVSTRYTAPTDVTYPIADADFSHIQSTGTVAAPYVDPDNQLATYPQLPGWEFTLLATADGAAGVEYDDDLAKYGFAASLRSPNYQLDQSSTGYLNITLDMASTYANDVKVTYYTQLPSGLKKEVSDTFTTTGEYTQYKTSLPTGKTPGYLTIAPAPNDRKQGNVLIRTLLIRVKFPQGATMELPYASESTQLTEATFTAPLIDDTYYLISVTAYEREPYQNLGYITRRASDPSETITYRPSSAVATPADDTAADDDPIQYYNLQGIPVANPTPGHLYIRRQGPTSTTIRL